MDRETRMNKMKYTKHIVGLIAVSLLAACGKEEPPPEASAAESAPKVVKPASEPKDDPSEKMARAVGGGKPGAAVDIRYEFAAKPEVGKPVQVEVALVPSAGVDAMDVTFTGMEGITLAGELQASFESVKPGELYKHSLSVLANQGGVYYITASVNTQIGGATLSRTFAVPFVAGTAPAQKKPEPVTDGSGQAVQPMQAEEPTDP